MKTVEYDENLWQLVPVTLTEEMKFEWHYQSGVFSTREKLWNCILAAAPQPPAQDDAKDAQRYAAIRKLYPRQFTELWQKNMNGDGKFDDLVDAIAAAQGEAK